MLFQQVNICQLAKVSICLTLVWTSVSVCFVCVYVCAFIHVSCMCAWLLNDSCAFCNPGQWVERKSVRSVKPRWEREQPWSSSPLDSVIIWVALSASTVSLTLEDQKPGLKSEYETSSSTVTPATCESKLVNQHLCDVTVLQQIDEETTSDNNPWILKWTLKPLQLTGTLGWDVSLFMILLKPQAIPWWESYLFLQCVIKEGTLAK